MDNFPHYSPTQNWRILEFWAKFLEFFVEILEFFSKSLSFFSKTLEFYNQGGRFSWNVEFYPSFFFNFMSLDRKFTLNYCYYKNIATILLAKRSISGKTGVFFTIFMTKNFLRNYIRRELADLRVFEKIS